MEALKMFRTKISTTNMALAGAVSFLLASSAFAQIHTDSRTYQQQSRRQVNRVVEGTVASVVHDRNGDRVRLTSGMDLVVPNSVTAMNQGRRYGASTLQPGDVVRMNVYSRQGDGRDAQVRSLEILQTNSSYNNDRRLNGTVVSVDRRGRSLVVRTDQGQTINVDFNAYASRSATSFRRGDRISITGRMDRGTVIADDIRLSNNRR
jgi:hypothetical protein